MNFSNNPHTNNIHFIAASHRSDSVNKKLLTLASKLVTSQNAVNIVNHDYASFDFPLYNDEIRSINGIFKDVFEAAKLLQNADALILAVPEYNWSYPASLKNIIDWFSVLDNNPLHGKAVFLMCATPSERGGMMCLTHLKTVLDYMGMWVYPVMFGLGKEHEKWEGDKLVEKYQIMLEQQLNGFMNFCQKISN